MDPEQSLAPGLSTEFSMDLTVLVLSPDLTLRSRRISFVGFALSRQAQQDLDPTLIPHPLRPYSAAVGHRRQPSGDYRTVACCTSDEFLSCSCRGNEADTHGTCELDCARPR